MYRLYRRGEREIALEKLGIETLHMWQEEVLPHILCFEDVLYMIPTSGGKSLLYQLPAVMDGGAALTIVISPMLALQKDQVSTMRDHGIQSEFLNSELSVEERYRILNGLGSVSLLYLAPEQLGSHDLLNALSRCEVSRVVVDEAHLLPEQKDGFRPAFAQIGNFIRSFADRPQVIACTATATETERKTIIESLHMDEPFVYEGSIHRSNLYLAVKHVSKKEYIENLVLAELNNWNKKGRALIFAPSIPMVKELKGVLKNHGVKALGYHAKMSPKDKENNVEKFRSGKCKVMIATSAFGLGVDIPNIHLIIHAGLPLGFSDYVQQIGRGGRDGKPTRCVLIYTKSSKSSNMFTVLKSGPANYARKSADMDDLLDAICSDTCLWESIAKFYGQKLHHCGHCDHCQRK